MRPQINDEKKQGDPPKYYMSNKNKLSQELQTTWWQLSWPSHFAPVIAVLPSAFYLFGLA